MSRKKYEMRKREDLDITNAPYVLEVAEGNHNVRLHEFNRRQLKGLKRQIRTLLDQTAVKKGGKHGGR